MLPRYWIEHRDKNMDVVGEFQSIVPTPLSELQAPPQQSLGVPQKDLVVFNQLLDEFDQLRFGMSFHEFQSVVHDSDIQATFAERYGIPFREYLIRVLYGENMGECLVDGKFKPTSTED